MAKQKKHALFVQYWLDSAGSRRRRLLANEREVTAVRFIDEKDKKYITTAVFSLLNPRKIAFVNAKGNLVEHGFICVDGRISMQVLETCKVEYIYRNKKR